MRYKIHISGNSTILWFQNYQLHRLYGPAIEHEDGDRWWYKNDTWHRLDGPARELCNGDREWWINDKRYSEKEYNKVIKTGKK